MPCHFLAGCEAVMVVLLHMLMTVVDFKDMGKMTQNA